MLVKLNIIDHMDLEKWSGQRDKSILDCGEMELNMVLVFWLSRMVKSLNVTGKTMSFLDKVLYHLLINLLMLVSGMQTNEMVKVRWLGQMVHNMMENGLTINDMEKAR